MELDVTLVRLIWLMLIFFGGWGLIGYLVAWIIMPQEPEALKASADAPLAEPQPARSQ